jgi:hypothetical protein
LPQKPAKPALPLNFCAKKIRRPPFRPRNPSPQGKCTDSGNYFKELVDYFKLYEKKNQLKLTYTKEFLASFGAQDSADIIMDRQK